MTKIFAAGINQETNTFNIHETTLDGFRTLFLFHGEDIRKNLAGTRLEWGGMFEVADRYGWEVVAAVAAWAFPSGRATKETYAKLSSDIVDALTKALPVDGVFLSLHGSMAAVGCDDVEGDIIGRVRKIVGHRIPIAVSLDLHANVSPAMAEGADILTSFRTTPHIDMYETGQRAAELLNLVCTTGVRLKTVRAQRPMLTGLDLGRTVDPRGPMPRLLSRAREIERENKPVRDISLCAGFPYGDTYFAGPSVLVVAEHEFAEAAAIAEELADEAWKTRAEVTIDFLEIEEAAALMRQASSAPDPSGPLIVTDYADGVGGGAYGEGTLLLGAMLQADLNNAVYGMIRDPEVVKIAKKAGVGATIQVSLGGKTDPHHGGGPIDIRAEVVQLSDGAYIRKGPYGTGSAGALGPSVLLKVGGLLITVCTELVQAEDREQFRIFGIHPEQMAVVALKGINHFRADFEAISSRLVFVDSKGLSSPDLSRFAYKNVRRPIWPLDEMLA